MRDHSLRCMLATAAAPCCVCGAAPGPCHMVDGHSVPPHRKPYCPRHCPIHREAKAGGVGKIVKAGAPGDRMQSKFRAFGEYTKTYLAEFRFAERTALIFLALAAAAA